MRIRAEGDDDRCRLRRSRAHRGHPRHAPASDPRLLLLPLDRADERRLCSGLLARTPIEARPGGSRRWCSPREEGRGEPQGGPPDPNLVTLLQYRLLEQAHAIDRGYAHAVGDQQIGLIRWMSSACKRETSGSGTTPSVSPDLARWCCVRVTDRRGRVERRGCSR